MNDLDNLSYAERSKAESKRKQRLFYKRRKANKDLDIDEVLKEYVNLKLEVEMFWKKISKED